MTGKHKNPRRKLSQTPEAYQEQDEVAREEGVDWSDWARTVLDEAVRVYREENSSEY